MGAQKLSMLIKTHLDFVDKGLFCEFVCRTMFRLAKFFWVFFSTHMINLFGLLIRYFFRNYENCLTNGLILSDIHEEEIDTNCSGDFKLYDFGEEEKSELSFSFLLPKSGDYKVSDRRIGETESSVSMETESTPITSKYEFISGKNFSGFFEEPKTMKFTVQELFVGSHEDFSINNGQDLDLGVSADKDFQNLNPEAKFQKSQVGSPNASIDNNIGFYAEKEIEELYVKSEAFDQEKTKDSVQSLCEEEVFEQQEQIISSTDHELYENEEMVGFEISSKYCDNLIDEAEFLSGSLGNQKTDSTMPCLEEIGFSDEESIDDDDDEYIELKPNFQNSSEFDTEIFFEKEMEFKGGEEKPEEPISGGSNLWDSDSEDEDDFEVLEEHKNLIEQIRMELKNARTGGLPTISEECETPRVLDDLKPLKFEEKIEHKDRMEEIQKVYKSYAEKMRKLDVLNYQTMHAISLLQLKDSFQLPSNRISSFSTIKSLIFPSFWPCKLRRVFADPTLKSVNELHRDLEMVYVGQVCLSWEILHWQYNKAKELLEHDSEGYRSYNQVVGELQQFQVLLQRFVENELYQGPRVQNYAQDRCFLRALLQVPAIKDDSLKDKKEIRVEGKDVISVAMLMEIIEESMHVFWDFLHADKNEANMILKVLQGTHARNQESIYSELMMDIKTILQKKEKRLKDIVRSRNCIVKKFQKHQEGRMDHSMFIAQVELRLVLRVLNYSRVTMDQLVWCQMKLDKIQFVGRRIHVEPSFLLFPF